MNEVSGQQHAQSSLNNEVETFNAIRPEDVRDFLLANPNFFNHFPDIAERLLIPHEKKGAVSLFELQCNQLREKVKQLSRKLSQLISVAKKNEEIYRIYADLNLQLLQCRYFSEVQSTLDSVMRDKLKMSAVSLRAFEGANAFPEIQRKLFMEKRFKQSHFFFGRLSQHEKQLLFAGKPAESVGLMLLGENGNFGILAVGSKDPSHFNPDMDTLLITQLQQFLNVYLPSLDGF
ncbi:DUF484 family protein [Aestuariibacter sp. AA17]|uniref:DUF484 family protein n=1 Tax=Fluctibacter corallii TaxID=2984329 RepID=A0ABT3AC92_9ALTE|nr:DUF484 family protein [Aestuariibacter sp. AA17]MCV2886235.1 DUF484 family protein [Aestuariibacter sp. AA17]